MVCDPYICPCCQYIGDGDSWCDEIGEIVLSDWEPTQFYMGTGCPFVKKKKWRKKKNDRSKERR